MTPIIAPIDLTITDTESGGATLTFTPLGEPSATYHLTTDTVRVLVNKLRAGWLVIDAQNADRREMACPPIEAWAWGGVDRDVATDPRPGDRLTPACAGYPTYVIAEVHNDRAHHLRCLNRHTGEPEGMTWLHWTGWRDLCRTPGAKVERWEGWEG